MIKNVNISKPNKNTKGSPPLSNSTKNNVEKPLNEDLVAFNFRVTAEFRKKSSSICN